MADFKQAIEWLKEGKKVRRKVWVKDLHIIYDDNEPEVINGVELASLGHMDNYEAIDWEIYCEGHDWEISLCHGLADSIKRCKNCGTERLIPFEKPKEERYPMCSNQDAQIDCRRTKCRFYKGAGTCSNVSPAITLNPDKSCVCWSEEFVDEVKEPKESLSDKRLIGEYKTHDGRINKSHLYHWSDVKEKIQEFLESLGIEKGVEKEDHRILASEVYSQAKNKFGKKLL